MFDMVLDTAHKMGMNGIWPTYQDSDRVGARMGDVTLGWLLLWQAGIAQDKQDDLFTSSDFGALEDACAENEDIAFYTGKVATAGFFMNRVLTLAPGKSEVIKNPDDSALTIPETAM